LADGVEAPESGVGAGVDMGARTGVAGGDRAGVDAVEARARALVEAMEAAGWDPAATPGVIEAVLGGAVSDGAVAAVLRFAAAEVVPRIAGTSDEITRVLHALDGG